MLETLSVSQFRCEFIGVKQFKNAEQVLVFEVIRNMSVAYHFLETVDYGIQNYIRESEQKGGVVQVVIKTTQLYHAFYLFLRKIVYVG